MIIRLKTLTSIKMELKTNAVKKAFWKLRMMMEMMINQKKIHRLMMIMNVIVMMNRKNMNHQTIKANNSKYKKIIKNRKNRKVFQVLLKMKNDPIVTSLVFVNKL